MGNSACFEPIFRVQDEEVDIVEGVSGSLFKGVDVLYHDSSKWCMGVVTTLFASGVVMLQPNGSDRQGMVKTTSLHVYLLNRAEEYFCLRKDRVFGTMLPCYSALGDRFFVDEIPFIQCAQGAAVLLRGSQVSLLAGGLSGILVALRPDGEVDVICEDGSRKAVPSNCVCPTTPGKDIGAWNGTFSDGECSESTGRASDSAWSGRSGSSWSSDTVRDDHDIAHDLFA